MSFRNVTEVRNVARIFRYSGADFPLQRPRWVRILRYSGPDSPLHRPSSSPMLSLHRALFAYYAAFTLNPFLYSRPDVPLQLPGFSVTPARILRYSGKLGGGPEGWPRGSGGGGPEGWRITPSEGWRITPCDSHHSHLSSIAQICFRGNPRLQTPAFQV